METTEKKIKHTPGPWFQSHIQDKTDGMYYTRVYDHKDIIATLHWYPIELAPGVTGTRREANAKLIAAAPELLRSCIQLLQCRLDVIEEAGDNPDHWYEVRLAKEAIKNATL